MSTTPGTGPPMMSGSSALGARITAVDPGNLLYGAVISASVLATVSAHPEAFPNAAVADAVVLGVYWLAHLYVAAQSGVFDGDTRHILHRIREAAGHESAILLGGVPAIVVYLAGIVAGMEAGAAAGLAVYFSILLLAAAGYLAGKRAGMTGRAAVIDAAVAGLFGLVLIVAKALLH